MYRRSETWLRPSNSLNVTKQSTYGAPCENETGFNAGIGQISSCLVLGIGVKVVVKRQQSSDSIRSFGRETEWGGCFFDGDVIVASGITNKISR